jgi:GST-like protein
MTEGMIRLLGCKGCGSAMAEAFLTLGNLPFAREEVNYEEEGPARDRLLALNPLGQVPTLVLADGSVLTESLAVAVYVHAVAPGAGLIPRGDGELARFWRWATFLVAAIYPTFTYGDTPAKWVANAEGAMQLRASTDDWRKSLWRIVERECGSPYFLRETFSAIDVYLGAMVRWRPGRPWFEANCPKIAAVAARVAEDARLLAVWSLNFD